MSRKYDTSQEDKEFLECLFNVTEASDEQVSSKFIDLHNDNKERLREMMGGTYLKSTTEADFSYDEKHRILFHEIANGAGSMHKVRFEVFSLIRGFVADNDFSLSYVMDNRMLGGEKFTKWLPKQVEQLTKYVRESAMFDRLGVFRSIYPTLTNLDNEITPEWVMQHMITPFLNVYTTFYLPRIQKKEMTIIVSSKLEDFLLMGEQGIHSCHSVLAGNIHSAGPFSLAADSSTLVAYAYSSSKPLQDGYRHSHPMFFEKGKVYPYKIWRMLIYVNLDAGTAMLSRHYPTTRNDFSVEARKLLMTKMCEFAQLENKWIRSKRYSQLQHLTGLAYRGDEKTGQVTIASKFKEYKENRSFPTIPLETMPPCPLCGEDNLSSPNRITCGCSSANMNCCGHCGCELEYDSDRYETPDGDILCCDCFYDSYCRCEDCGETMTHDDAYYAGDYPYCEDCYNRSFFSCDCCEESHDRSEMVEVETKWGCRYYCECCANEQTVTCEYCDAVLDDNPDRLWDEIDSVVVCKECQEKYFSTCDICDEVFHVDDLVTDSNGFNLCEECTKTNEDEEEVEE